MDTLLILLVARSLLKVLSYTFSAQAFLFGILLDRVYYFQAGGTIIGFLVDILALLWHTGLKAQSQLFLERSAQLQRISLPLG